MEPDYIKEFDTKNRGIKDSSVDKGNQEMLRIAREQDVETAFDRVKQQDMGRCKFCADGISCRNCNMGPCRITPKAPKGVCGATADTMVARGLLKNAIGGSASHQDHGRHVAITLYEAGKGKAPYEIKDEKKLREICEKLGIEGAKSKGVKELAVEVAGKAFEDYGRQHGEEVPHWIKLRSSKERIDTWKKLGVAVKELPVVASAPEYTTEKALSIGTWAVALGINTHVNPPPRIAGSEAVANLVTEKAEELLGGGFFLGNDPGEVAEKMVEIIDKKREGLGL